jgi:hypothetical protein
MCEPRHTSHKENSCRPPQWWSRPTFDRDKTWNEWDRLAQATIIWTRLP